MKKRGKKHTHISSSLVSAQRERGSRELFQRVRCTERKKKVEGEENLTPPGEREEVDFEKCCPGGGSKKSFFSKDVQPELARQPQKI